MWVEIETYCSWKFKEIQEEYGSVLESFNLKETDNGCASIFICTYGDFFILNQSIKDFCEKSDRAIPYFGLMIKSRDDKTPYLEIKDNYD